MVDTEEWNRVVGVNLTGTFLTAKHVIARCWSSGLESTGSGARW